MYRQLDRVDRALLDGWQRDLPLVPRPFAEIALAEGLTETEIIARLRRLTEAGTISRVGATCRPNTIGASTLAALAAPVDRLEEVAGVVGVEPGVNHSYQRENHWNLWFVVTGPDRAHVDAALGRIRRQTGLKVLDLPLIRAFNVDLGFALNGSGQPPPQNPQKPYSLVAGDREVAQALSNGLALTERPFRTLGAAIGLSEDETLLRVRKLAEAGVLSRIGVIVRHRALGWRSNAMVVWEASDAVVGGAGPALCATPGVTLCYQRRPAPGLWPYSLYCMIHARSRREAMAVLDRAERAAGLAGAPRQVLFSTRCFKQSGALVSHARKRASENAA